MTIRLSRSLLNVPDTTHTQPDSRWHRLLACELVPCEQPQAIGASAAGAVGAPNSRS